MKVITFEAVKDAAETYLAAELAKHEATAALLGNYPVRDLVVLLMAGFAAEQVSAELRDVFGFGLTDGGAGSDG